MEKTDWWKRLEAESWGGGRGPAAVCWLTKGAALGGDRTELLCYVPITDC